MIFDATFWVAISFLIFIIILIYFKIPQKIIEILNTNINNIRDQINEAEKLKEEAKNTLSEHEKKISNSKKVIQKMIGETNNSVEKNVLKVNKEFHSLMENRKRNTEERIRQMKEQALKDIKNASVKIAIESVERLLKNSLNKNKLDKLYVSSINETKIALQKKSR